MCKKDAMLQTREIMKHQKRLGDAVSSATELMGMPQHERDEIQDDLDRRNPFFQAFGRYLSDDLAE